jgi:hypothetical protein
MRYPILLAMVFALGCSSAKSSYRNDDYQQIDNKKQELREKSRSLMESIRNR